MLSFFHLYCNPKEKGMFHETCFLLIFNTIGKHIEELL